MSGARPRTGPGCLTVQDEVLGVAQSGRAASTLSIDRLSKALVQPRVGAERRAMSVAKSAIPTRTSTDLDLNVRIPRHRDHLFRGIVITVPGIVISRKLLALGDDWACVGYFLRLTGNHGTFADLRQRFR